MSGIHFLTINFTKNHETFKSFLQKNHETLKKITKNHETF